MNKKAFDALPDQYKAMIEVAGQAQVAYTYAETEAMQFDAMAEMRDKHKVQIKRWSDKDLATFEKAWLEVLQRKVGERSALQEDCRSLPRLPQAVCHLGGSADAEGDLPGREVIGRRRGSPYLPRGGKATHADQRPASVSSSHRLSVAPCISRSRRARITRKLRPAIWASDWRRGPSCSCDGASPARSAAFASALTRISMLRAPPRGGP